jgi:predicted branched-subunit amino acid permease
MAGRGVADALKLPAWVIGLSLFGIGSLAQQVGIPFLATFLSTPLIWAGPAQFVLFAGYGSGLGVLSVALAVSLTSVRLLPMGLSILPMMRRRGHGLLMQAALTHAVVISTWAEGMMKMPRMRRRDRAPWFLGFGYGCATVATLMCGFGFVMAAQVPPALAAVFLFVTPMFFTLSLVGGARSLADASAIVLGTLLVPVITWAIGPELSLLLTGLIGGTLAYLLHRLLRRRSQG